VRPVPAVETGEGKGSALVVVRPDTGACGPFALSRFRPFFIHFLTK
jgi:hypothetical protein